MDEQKKKEIEDAVNNIMCLVNQHSTLRDGDRWAEFDIDPIECEKHINTDKNNLMTLIEKTVDEALGEAKCDLCSEIVLIEDIHSLPEIQKSICTECFWDNEENEKLK